ncbi:phage major capsid protein [Rhodococcus erythropolis]|uniref:Phage major capsid protein n=1 Tax=Rhodococcus erythropolis TaxID=1833 RepID=A0AAX4A086_RHOER|nr:phage major capsid protein [Rhodococcus erythropolis]WMN02117.1 phage major capsid protein [Rhodococcus erythropolis]
MPEEFGSEVIAAAEQNSAVEAYGRKVKMNTNTAKVPRIGESVVSVIGKSQPYPEDPANLDQVLLDTIKFGGQNVLAEEDLADSNVNIIAALQKSWATGYAKTFDNACLGTTAVSNGGNVPFTSVYKEVSTSAAAHKIATAGPVTYDKVSQTFGKVEQGGYFSDSDMLVIAHTSLKESLRGLVDGNGRPLFIEQVSATQPATLFGYALRCSDGSKTSAKNEQNPTGNPLLIVANRQHLIVGVREEIESRLSIEAGWNTDEPHLKMRARRAFAVGRAKAFGVLEVTGA